MRYWVKGDFYCFFITQNWEALVASKLCIDPRSSGYTSSLSADNRVSQEALARSQRSGPPCDPLTSVESRKDQCTGQRAFNDTPHRLCVEEGLQEECVEKDSGDRLCALYGTPRRLRLMTLEGRVRVMGRLCNKGVSNLMQKV